MEPTERSMLPIRIINVPPSAQISRSVEEVNTLKRLLIFKNLPAVVNEKRINKITNAAKEIFFLIKLTTTFLFSIFQYSFLYRIRPSVLPAVLL